MWQSYSIINLQGRGKLGVPESLETLVHAIDVWTESNTSSIFQIEFSRKFMGKFIAETGVRPNELHTLTGTCPVLVTEQTEDIKIT